MHILHSLLNELNEEFSESKQGKERRVWFMYTLLAIILPFTSSRTSNLLRALKALFGFTYIGKKRYTLSWVRRRFPGTGCGPGFGN